MTLGFYINHEFFTLELEIEELDGALEVMRDFSEFTMVRKDNDIKVDMNLLEDCKK